jgi:SAM-dependent methyltransferase
MRAMQRISLNDLTALPPPAPWRDGDNIPWHEPGFSRRMLEHHLSPGSDSASRRPETIDAHVARVHEEILSGRPGRLLDLGCGPGLYTSRLARLGHTCEGIDYSPASIEYAVETAQRECLRCSYRCEDIRTAEYGDGFDLVMLISGELNVFRPEDARAILRTARAALDDGGTLMLEAHPFDHVRRIGQRARSWYAASRGLFSDELHVLLQEHAWDEATSTATTRYTVIDAATAGATVYAQTFQSYSDDQYRALLNECGFKDVTFVPSLDGSPAVEQPVFCAIIAR